MHTVKVLAAGFLLLVVCILVGRELGGAVAGARVALALKIFVPLWFIGSAANLWVGVTRAGYSVAEELPVFAIVFAVPVAVALLLWWFAGRAPA
jgi:hypothetical protein